MSWLSESPVFGTCDLKDELLLSSLWLLGVMQPSRWPKVLDSG